MPLITILPNIFKIFKIFSINYIPCLLTRKVEDDIIILKFNVVSLHGHSRADIERGLTHEI